jgi:hypothetical protein
MAVAGLGDGKSTYTYDDTNVAVHSTGRWTHAAKPRWTDADFDNTESYGSTAGDRASVTFTGTAVRWIGPTNTDGGIADVYLDGAKVATVDTYSQAGKNFQEGLYRDTNPTDGQHTLDVVVTGQENPATTADTVVVDALDLHGTDDAPVAPCSCAASPSSGSAATRSRSPTSTPTPPTATATSA